MTEPVRFTDVLTIASAVASYLGEPEVQPGHVLAALGVLLGEQRMEDLGRPVSPLARRASGGASDAVRALAGRWWAELGGSPAAELDERAVQRLRDELATMTQAAD